MLNENKNIAVDLSVLSREALIKIVFDLMQARKDDQQELDDVHAFANTLGETNDELEDKCAQLENDIESLKGELSELKKDYSDAVSDAVKGEKDYHALKKEYQNLQASVSAFADDLADKYCTAVDKYDDASDAWDVNKLETMLDNDYMRGRYYAVRRVVSAFNYNMPSVYSINKIDDYKPNMENENY